jgi:hypothetical protein
MLSYNLINLRTQGNIDEVCICLKIILVRDYTFSVLAGTLMPESEMFISSFGSNLLLCVVVSTAHILKPNSPCCAGCICYSVIADYNFTKKVLHPGCWHTLPGKTYLIVSLQLLFSMVKVLAGKITQLWVRYGWCSALLLYNLTMLLVLPMLEGATRFCSPDLVGVSERSLRGYYSTLTYSSWTCNLSFCPFKCKWC